MKCSCDDLRGIYDNFAPRYDRHIAWLGMIAGLRRLRRKLFRGACGNVLDVATGTGANVEFFPASCTITGVDLSREMLTVAQRRAEELQRNVTLREMDAEHLSFPSDSFDTVTSALSLCTIPNPDVALKEMSRVCKPNGKILLLEHGPSDWQIIAALQRVFVGDWHVRAFGCHWDREPAELVEEAGLRITEHQRRFLGMLHAIEAIPAK